MDSEYALVPGIRRPPLLVPVTGHVAASAVRHFSGRRSRAVRLITRAFSLCLASGLGGAVHVGRVRIGTPSDAESIETYLRGVVGRDIRVSMYLGPPRANRKPVLQLLTEAGEPVAFAKIGTTPLTRDLVRAERAALTSLDQVALNGITVPQVLHHGRWNGLDVLLLSTLPVWRHRRPLEAGTLTAAMSAVAGMGDLPVGPIRDSGYLQRLHNRVAAIDQAPERAALLRELSELTARHGDTALRFGAWHGDWSPWNMASTDQGLLLWDWERYGSGVPLGFDALHYQLQTDIGPGHRNPRAAADRCVMNAPQSLAPFSIPADQARLTGALYLADLATRYLADHQRELGARHGSPGTWLIPAIAAAVSADPGASR